MTEGFEPLIEIKNEIFKHNLKFLGFEVISNYLHKIQNLTLAKHLNQLPKMVEN